MSSVFAYTLSSFVFTFTIDVFNSVGIAAFGFNLDSVDCLSHRTILPG